MRTSKKHKDLFDRETYTAWIFCAISRTHKEGLHCLRGYFKKTTPCPGRSSHVINKTLQRTSFLHYLLNKYTNTMSNNNQDKDDSVLFLDLNPENPTTEIESACVNCGENGTTKFMLTSIPFFKQIIISSFECPHCDYSNKAVQYGSVQDSGVRYTLKVTGSQVSIFEHFLMRIYCLTLGGSL